MTEKLLFLAKFEDKIKKYFDFFHSELKVMHIAILRQ